MRKVTEKQQRLAEIVRQSPFSLSPNYSITVDFKYLVSTLKDYNLFETEGLEDPMDIIKACTPVFQRDNDKWTREMQVSYIENALGGCATEIQLYTLMDDNGTYSKCKILDGLQRSTAHAAFKRGEFQIFDEFNYEDSTARIVSSVSRITVKIYCFESEIEAVEYYIQMNENITHSSEDIIRAKEYLAKLKAEANG